MPRDSSLWDSLFFSLQFFQFCIMNIQRGNVCTTPASEEVFPNEFSQEFAKTVAAILAYWHFPALFSPVTRYQLRYCYHCQNTVCRNVSIYQYYNDYSLKVSLLRGRIFFLFFSRKNNIITTPVIMLPALADLLLQTRRTDQTAKTYIRCRRESRLSA